jgi:hypothetical protein
VVPIIRVGFAGRTSPAYLGFAGGMCFCGKAARAHFGSNNAAPAHARFLWLETVFIMLIMASLIPLARGEQNAMHPVRLVWATCAGPGKPFRKFTGFYSGRV